MNGQIKIRAWDETTKVMYYPRENIHVPVTQFDICLMQFFIGRPDWSSRYGPYQLMMWTGLKDIKGKDIYEGDLVKLYWPAATTLNIIRFGKHAAAVDDSCERGIAWGFYFEDQGNKQLGWDGLANTESLYSTVSLDLHSMEVVGNIYENPEENKDISGGK